MKILNNWNCGLSGEHKGSDRSANKQNYNIATVPTQSIHYQHTSVSCVSSSVVALWRKWRKRYGRGGGGRIKRAVSLSLALSLFFFSFFVKLIYTALFRVPLQNIFTRHNKRVSLLTNLRPFSIVVPCTFWNLLTSLHQQMHYLLTWLKNFKFTAYCKMGTGFSPGVKCGRSVLLTTHPILVPRTWKSRAIPLSTLWATPGL